MRAWLFGSFLFSVPLTIAASCGGGGASLGSGAATSAASTSVTGTVTASSSSVAGAGGASTVATVGATSGIASSAASATSGSSSGAGGGTTCAAVDPMNDMKPCGMGCPAGQICFGAGTCYLACDPNDQGTCPCDRYCGALETSDGAPAGGACFPANTEGMRCGTMYGQGSCAQNLACVSAAGTTNAYCSPTCTTQADCPPHTGCVQIEDMGKVVGMACVYDYGPSGKPAGSTCGATDSCISLTLCDTTCLPQCDGPGGMCTTGTCTAVVEGTTTLGYVCK